MKTKKWHIFIFCFLFLAAFSLPRNAFASPVQLAQVGQFRLDATLLTSFLFLVVAIVTCAILFIRWKSQQQIENLRYRDDLTGFTNYNKFKEDSQRRLHTSGTSQPLAILYLDINKFKYINDNFGYAEGDRILRSLSQTLARWLQPGEFFARISADNFVALVAYENNVQLRERLDQLLTQIDRLPLEGHPYQLVVSMGLSFYDGQTDLLSLIDQANYARGIAKVGPGNAYVFYEEKFREAVKNEKEIEQRMRSALANGEFIPYYQPQVNILTDTIIGVEALARWQVPGKGLLSPKDFIPIFEKNGFILELDLYIFEEVCKLLAERMQKNLPLYPIACNFSRSHFMDKQFPQKLLHLTEKYKVPTKYLGLEITENVAMANSKTIAEYTNLLKEYGFAVAIDDFGSGYSSLSILRDLPVDALKLDKAFLGDVALQEKGRTIVQKVIALAYQLGMSVICEGVETAAQVAFLKSIDCHLAQGFYYSPAVSREEIMQLMDGQRKLQKKDYLPSQQPALPCEPALPIPRFSSAVPQSTDENGQERLQITMNHINYKKVLASLSNPVFLIDTEMRIFFMNSAAEKATGLSLSQCLGQSCSILGTPFCRTKDCCVERFKRGAEPAIQHGMDGHIFRISLSPLLDDKGKTVGYINLSIDISELAQTSQELKLSEDSYRIALAQTNNVMWQYDIEHKTLHQSPDQAKNLFPRYDIGEIVENVPESFIEKGLVDEDYVETFRNFFAAIHRGDKFSSCIIKIKDMQDRYHWLELNNTTIFDKKGQPLQAVGVGRDITVTKKMEQQYLQERRFRDSIFSDAMATYEVNLTKDQLLHIDSHWFDVLQIPKATTYTVLLQALLDHGVHPQFCQYLENLASRDNLLAAFHNGKTHVQMEYQCLNQEKQMVWVHTTIYMIETPLSGDICAFIYIKNIDKEKKQELELVHKAELDALTGLHNRVSAMAKIDSLLQLQKPQMLHAFFMIDIDNFKQINDTYGHLYGDAVLSELAMNLHNLFRKEDILCRLGGDEFAVFLYNIPNENIALRKAAEVLKSLETVFSAGGKVCQISCSLGIAFFPQHGDNFEQLYAKADAAVYQAKHQGKNQYALYYDGLENTSMATVPPQENDGPRIAKRFSENVLEYVFKILYYSNNLDLAIHSVLELLAKHYDAQHVYLFEQTPNQIYRMTFEWRAPNLPPQTQLWPQVHISKYEKAFGQQLRQNGILCISDFAQASPELQKYAHENHMQATIQCLFDIDNGLQGSIGVDDYQKPHSFDEQDKDTLKTVAGIISLFLAKKHYEENR